MKIIASFFFICVASALMVSSCNKGETPNVLFNQNDSLYVRKASMSNFAEITLGQIAADSATDPSIKQYGARMVTEHTAEQSQLSAIASGLGIGLTNSLDAQHQLLLDSLLTFKGRTFDSIYIHSQVRDHQNTIDFFKQHSAHGLQKDLKQYVFEVLPEISLHFQDARTISTNY